MGPFRDLALVRGERRQDLVLLRRRDLELVERLREDAGDRIELVGSDVQVAMRLLEAQPVSSRLVPT